MPGALPIVGHLPFFMADPIGFLTNAAAVSGDVAHFRLGKLRFCLMNHPELVKDVLVTQSARFERGRALQRAKVLLGEGLLTSDGAFHQRQRRLVQPAFHRARYAAYGQLMADESETFTSRWRDGARVDMAHEMATLTLGIVGRTLFGADVAASAGEVDAALADILEAAKLSRLPVRIETLAKLPLPMVRRFFDARDRLDALIYRLIAERRADGTDRGDLLSMLLAAQDEEGTGGMTDEQVRDEAMTLFLAGYETMATALGWVWVLLAQHPEVEARLHAELEAVLGDRSVTFEDVSALPYTRMLLSEALRLRPPVWVIGRRAMVDTEVAGHAVPAGTYVLMSQYMLQRDPRFWDDPLAFKPERWAEAATDRPKYAYFPFGGGPRTCIGEHFAWTEGVVAIATLARRFRARLVPGYRDAFKPMIVLRPKHGLPMQLERR